MNFFFGQKLCGLGGMTYHFLALACNKISKVRYATPTHTNIKPLIVLFEIDLVRTV